MAQDQLLFYVLKYSSFWMLNFHLSFLVVVASQKIDLNYCHIDEFWIIILKWRLCPERVSGLSIFVRILTIFRLVEIYKNSQILITLKLKLMWIFNSRNYVKILLFLFLKMWIYQKSQFSINSSRSWDKWKLKDL